MSTTIREDVVSISFDVEQNPFADITAGVEEMKAAVVGGVDSSTEALKGIAQGANKAADSIKDIGTTNQKTQKTFTQMVKSAKDMAAVKIGGGLDKLKSIPQQAKGQFDKLKTSISNIKNVKLSDIGKGLDKALGAGVTGAGKLFAGLKKAAGVGFEKAVSGLKSMATHAATAAKAIGGGMAKAAGVVGAGVAAAGVAVAGIVSKSVTAYADYEQLIGGVETLFGTGGKNLQEYAQSVGKTTSQVAKEYASLNAAEKAVMTNANNAYKTAGLSANKYMETVTSFSASLIQSVGGDTQKAAALADTAITDMSDNANKMGTSMDTIIETYQSMAKGNYAMLDNLKLGYGGTKTEMQRLIKDAAKIDKSVDANSMSYGNLVKAIHAVQTKMGITGTTAKEAEGTISGSLAAVKATWANLLPALVQGGGNLDQCITNLVSSVKTFAGNIMPVIQKALSGVSTLIAELAPVIVKEVPTLVQTALPALLSAATSIVQGLISALPSILQVVVGLINNQGLNIVKSLVSTIQSNIGTLAGVAVQLISSLATFILQAAPQIIMVGLQLLLALAQGIAQQLPVLIPMAIQAIMTLVQGLIGMLPQLIQTGLQVIVSLVQGIAQSLPILIPMGIQALISLIQGIVQCIPMLIQTALGLIPVIINVLIQNLPLLVEGGIQLLVALIQGLVEAIPQLIAAIPQIVTAIKDALLNVDWIGVGKKLIGSVWNGVKSLFGGGQESGKQAANSVASGITASSGTATSAGNSLATSTTNSLKLNTGTLNSYGTAGASSLASGITSGTGAAVSAASNMSAQVEKAAATDVKVSTEVDTAGMEKAKAAVQGMVANIKARLAQLRPAFNSAFVAAAAVASAQSMRIKTAVQINTGQMLAFVTMSLTKLRTVYMMAFTLVVQVVALKMAELNEAVKHGAVQMDTTIMAALNGIQSSVASVDLSGAGVNMMSGLASGMESMRGTVIATAASIAAEAAAAINTALKIKSPSRVTMASGEFAGEGLDIGMQNKYADVKKTATGLGTAVEAGTKPAMNTYTPSSSSVSNTSTSNVSNNFNPVFTLNMNGASATESNKHKVKQWVKESIQECFESMGRTNPELCEV